MLVKHGFEAAIFHTIKANAMDCEAHDLAPYDLSFFTLPFIL